MEEADDVVTDVNKGGGWDHIIMGFAISNVIPTVLVMNATLWMEHAYKVVKMDGAATDVGKIVQNPA